ncbi:MAG: DUF692 family protein [Trueperaceae bacterium]|nr:DUF692 family protein [Trueperaceae bacterium]
MVALAVNDTPCSRALLRDGHLRADYLETSGPHVEDAVAALPGVSFLLHNSVWDWSLGHPDALAQRDVLALTRRRLQLTRAPWLSIHIGFSAAEVRFDDGMRPASRPVGSEELLPVMTRNVRDFAAHLDVPLLLENLDHNPTGAYDHVCDPNFIRTLVEASNAYLLLDLAHAQVSAARLGWDLAAYLAALPLGRVRQVHVSGPRRRDGVLADAHEPLREEDLALLRDVLRATTPWAVTLEYGRDDAALLAQVATLRELLATSDDTRTDA